MIEVGGEVVKLRHDIPPGRLRGRVAFDDEQLVELLIDIGRVNAQTGQDGILQQLLDLIAPSGQKHEQRGEQQQPQEQMHSGAVRELVITVTMMPVMKRAKATLNSSV